MAIRARRRTHRLALLVVGVLAMAGLVGTGGAASAADSGPVLTAASSDVSTASPGDVVHVHYAATSAVPLASVQVAYNFAGAPLRFSTPASSTPAADGVVDVPVPAGSPNATITLAAVILTDSSGAASEWIRTGAVQYSGGASGAPTHTLDLAAGDFVITGSTPDVADPVMTSLVAVQSAAGPGDRLTLHYDVTDASELTMVRVVLTNRLKAAEVTLVAQHSSVPASGELSIPVDDTWANGTYLVSTVEVRDLWNHTNDYFGPGSIYYPGPTYDVPDLGGVAVTVSGSPADHEPPVLTSMGPVTVTVGRSGTLSVPYRATDASGRVGSLSLDFYGGTPTSRFQLSGTDLPLEGVLTAPYTLPATASVGSYSLLGATVSDGHGGAEATYHVGGDLTQNGVQLPDHALDLTSVAVTVATPPDPATGVHVVPGDHQATMSWDFDLIGDNYSPLRGYTVTASPSGRSVTVGPGATSATVTGLTDLTRYTLSVRRINGMGASTPVSLATTPRAHGQRVVAAGDVDYDGRMDLVGVDLSGVVRPYRGNGRGGFLPSRVVARGWQSERMLVPSPTLGHVVRSVGYDGGLVVHFPRGTSTMLDRLTVSTGWQATAHAVAVGDWSGDSTEDVIALRDNGDLYLYRGTVGGERLGAPTRIGRGWTVYRTIVGVSDVTGDHRNDLLGVRPDGSLWLYAGNGHGGFSGAGHKVASGFAGARQVLAGPFDSRAGTDLVTLDSGGRLRLYSGLGHGRFAYRGVVATGWVGYL